MANARLGLTTRSTELEIVSAVFDALVRDALPPDENSLIEAVLRNIAVRSPRHDEILKDGSRLKKVERAVKTALELQESSHRASQGILTRLRFLGSSRTWPFLEPLWNDETHERLRRIAHYLLEDRLREGDELGGDLLVIDSGTTTFVVDEEIIRRRKQFRIATNNLLVLMNRVYHDLLDDLYVLPGRCSTNSLSIFGSEIEKDIQDLSPAAVVLSVAGLNSDILTAHDEKQAEVKKSLIEMACANTPVYILADSSKVGFTRGVKVISLDKLDRDHVWIITDGDFKARSARVQDQWAAIAAKVQSVLVDTDGKEMVA